MKIIVNSLEECYPSIEELSELGNVYKIMNDGKISIELDEKKFRIAENYDITRKPNLSLSSNDLSLSYFIINKHRIMASGNLTMNPDDTYVCDGPFRVFSQINVSTHDYLLAGQFDVSEKDSLNEYMINSTEKNIRRK